MNKEAQLLMREMAALELYVLRKLLEQQSYTEEGALFVRRFFEVNL